MILAAFSSCCCYEFWLPFPPAAAEAFAAGLSAAAATATAAALAAAAAPAAAARHLLMDYTRCAPVAAAAAARLVVRVKSLFPWRAPPCVCRVRRKTPWQ